MEIQISIIIATFNAGKTLEDCLKSIVPQLNEKTELIIIDGGSRDNTNEIIGRYKSYISYTVSEADRGIYDAWNKGVQAAHGQWVMFMGADDLLLPQAITQYLTALKSIPEAERLDYICAKDEYADLNGRLIKLIGGPADWKIMRKRMNVAHVASLHHKYNLFGEVGLYNLDFKICADYELLLRKGDRLRHAFLPVCIARMKTGGMSFSVRAIKETYRIRKHHRTVSGLNNRLLFLRDWLAFRFFIFRKSLLGKKYKTEAGHENNV